MIERLYGITREQFKQLYCDGLIWPANYLHFEVWEHYKEMLEVYGNSRKASADVRLHYRISKQHFYYIKKKMEQIEKAHLK